MTFPKVPCTDVPRAASGGGASGINRAGSKPRVPCPSPARLLFSRPGRQWPERRTRALAEAAVIVAASPDHERKDAD